MPQTAIHPGLVLECAPDAYAGLLPELRQALEAAAWEYHGGHLQEPPWIVTSARRTLRHQAELMAAMAPDQLVGMYCAHGRPSYIDALLAAAPLTADKAYAVLCSRTEGYISRHLSGAAVDLAASPVADPAALKALLQHHACAVLDETALGVPCYHVSWPQAPAVMIRA